MDKIKAVIFDLDGTLIDTAQDVHESLNKALIQMQLPTLSIEQSKKAIGPGADRFVHVVLGSEQQHRLHEFVEAFRPIYEQGCLGVTKPFPDMTDLLRKLAGYRLAIATNKRLSTTRHMLEGLHLDSFFDVVVGPELVQRLKPAPDMIHYVLKHLQLAPIEALMVGDTDNDILAARAAGVRVCAVNWGYAAREDLESLHPDFFVNTPMDIYRILQNGNPALKE